MLLKNYLLLLIAVALVACTEEEQPNELLQEAHQIHVEAVKIEQSIQPALAKMETVKQQLKPKQAEWTAEEQLLWQQITDIERSYAFWKDNHIEVPGFEHEDHHDHDHDHDHSHHHHDHAAHEDMAPEDMLLIQQEFKDTLSTVVARLEQLDFLE